ncbi:30S ribosomal protein S6 [Candidatus Dependentiae bacterium]|nr:30S ribosomal protein S6 [Candidatus Dependentiae bacterium]
MASLVRYETLMLMSTDVTDDELSMIEKNFDLISSNAKGKISRFDKWGKYRLAYPVNKSAYGVYVLVRFELPKETAVKALPEIETLLKIKCNEIVWRHVTVKLQPNAPQTYHKPEPVDVARSSNIDSLLKENKMGNLLDSVDNITADSDEAEA